MGTACVLSFPRERLSPRDAFPRERAETKTPPLLLLLLLQLLLLPLLLLLLLLLAAAADDALVTTLMMMTTMTTMTILFGACHHLFLVKGDARARLAQRLIARQRRRGHSA